MIRHLDRRLATAVLTALAIAAAAPVLAQSSPPLLAAAPADADVVTVTERLDASPWVHPALTDALAGPAPVPVTLSIALPPEGDPVYSDHPARDGDLSPLVVDLTLAAMPGTARYRPTDSAIQTFSGEFTGEALVQFLDSPYLLGIDPAFEPIAPDARSRTVQTKATCSPSSTTACLHSQRFAVTGGWNGSTAQVACTATQFAAFHGGSLTNWELLINVVDGCGVNGYYWVQAGGATGHSWTFGVQDFVTLLKRSYVGSCPTIHTTAFAC